MFKSLQGKQSFSVLVQIGSMNPYSQWINVSLKGRTMKWSYIANEYSFCQVSLQK